MPTSDVVKEDRKAILVVEDGDTVRRVLSDYLRFWFPDYAVVSVTSGEEALDRIHEYAFHVVLMDIALPGINGIEATRRLKEITPEIPILIVTIYDHDDYRNEAEAAGAQAFLPKDRMYTDLIPMLRNHLGDAPPKELLS